MTTKKAHIKSVEKAINILNLFKENSSLSLNDITAMMDIPKTTAFGLIATLENLDMLECNNDTGKYSLGVNIFDLSSAKRSRFVLQREAFEQMRLLSKKYKKNTHITVLSGSDVIYVNSLTPPDTVTTATITGARAPANCTSSGKACLAALSDRELKERLTKKALKQLTPNSLTDPTELSAEIEKIRKCGYAIDSQESILGVIGVGAAIIGPNGRPVLGISIAGLTPYMHKRDIEIYSEEIKRIAELLTKRA